VLQANELKAALNAGGVPVRLCGLDSVKKRKNPCSCWESNRDSLAFQPEAYLLYLMTELELNMVELYLNSPESFRCLVFN
jgi:hypothetical protein